MKKIIDALYSEHDASKAELNKLLLNRDQNTTRYLFEKASELSRQSFGNKVYIRGLVELTSYCGNDCYYCGIRRTNKEAQRYRLTKDQIIDCCDSGYKIGFRTFVLQGGEDQWYTDEIMTDIISTIKKKYPDCAITLSIGEKPKETYQNFFDAGADRYLLRHETADPIHYKKLHPSGMSFDNRMECLGNLKVIGYQTGCGFMVGAPYQTIDNIVNELIFMKKFCPEMIGIGPFIPHKDTPFKNKQAGSAELTLFLMGIIRLMNPFALIPATTALGTIDDKGRENGVLAGANVIMPNLSPPDVREKYLLYDNKLCTGEEAAEANVRLEERMKAIGYEIVVERGDYIGERIG